MNSMTRNILFLLHFTIVCMGQSGNEDPFARFGGWHGSSSGTSGGNGQSSWTGSGTNFQNAGSGSETGSGTAPVPTPNGENTPPVQCEDKDEYCDQYENRGFCDSQNQYYQYMRKNCELSCRFCIPQSPSASGIANCPSPSSCPRLGCGEDQVLSQAENDCCPKCITRPSQGCTPVFEHQEIVGFEYNNLKCDTVGPIIHSACFGVCASASVLLVNGGEFKRCECCQGSDWKTLTTLINCYRPGYISPGPQTYDYTVITQCSCRECSDTASNNQAQGSSSGLAGAAANFRGTAGNSDFWAPAAAESGAGEGEVNDESFGGMMVKVASFNS
ncbi:uncharacterized protein LOC134840362 [Symsagittifera roscoffensis]|uniref:uncharacterized protein LOC134840362 n=1 Tax=Symsagittifera roscoffensis TaxID=84072 RepID=UPI00307BF317